MAELGGVMQGPTPEEQRALWEQEARLAMRPVARQLLASHMADIEVLKGMGFDMHVYLSSLGSSRELSLAKTALEDCIMRAMRHITG